MSENYYYRRHLGVADLLPAAAVGVAAGLAGFYLVQLLIQRTPLVPEDALARSAGPPEPRSTPSGRWDRTPGG